MDCHDNISAAISFARQQSAGNPWMQQCVTQLDFADIRQNGGLVGASGTAVICFNELTWGVTKAICDKYCSYSQIPPSSRFNLISFIQGFSSLVLPWFALAAQLPYEAGGLGSNIMSGILALGSPTLIMYSLSMTISNQRWARKLFRRAAEKARALPAKEREAWKEIVESMSDFVQKAQQEPLRVEFLYSVNFGTLKEQRDAWNLSLAAIASWIVTIVITFLSVFGNIDAALPAAAGMLWMWMIPVVVGWVAVGTQSRDLGAMDAFEEAFGLGCGDTIGQKGNRARAGTVDLESIPNVEEEDEEAFLEDQRRGITWVSTRQQRQGPDAHGDIDHRGPLYNYARAATLWQFARELERYATTEIESLLMAKGSAAPTVPPVMETVSVNFGTVSYTRKQDESSAPILDPKDESALELKNLDNVVESVVEPAPNGDSPAPSPRHCGTEISSKDFFSVKTEVLGLEGEVMASPDEVSFPTDENPAPKVQVHPFDMSLRMAYPSLGEFWRQRGKWHLIWPHLMALFVQLTSAMAAFLVAFQTPPVGLGCSSGSYLLYMVTSIVAYILLVISASISHQVLHNEHQRRADGHDGLDLRTPTMVTRAYWACILRRAGKGLAIANCWWLVLSTFFELTGVYNTCLCNSSFFGLRSAAWIVLFQAENNLKIYAQDYWIGAVVMAGLFWFVAIIPIVWLTRWKRG